MSYNLWRLECYRIRDFHHFLSPLHDTPSRILQVTDPNYYYCWSARAEKNIFSRRFRNWVPHFVQLKHGKIHTVIVPMFIFLQNQNLWLGMIRIRLFASSDITGFKRECKKWQNRNILTFVRKNVKPIHGLQSRPEAINCLLKSRIFLVTLSLMCSTM